MTDATSTSDIVLVTGLSVMTDAISTSDIVPVTGLSAMITRLQNHNNAVIVPATEPRTTNPTIDHTTTISPTV